MRSKLVSLLLVALLLLASFSTALAQDGVYCGDLSADDCAILQSAQEAMMSVMSYKSDATYSATVSAARSWPRAGRGCRGWSPEQALHQFTELVAAHVLGRLLHHRLGELVANLTRALDARGKDRPLLGL